VKVARVSPVAGLTDAIVMSGLLPGR